MTQDSFYKKVGPYGQWIISGEIETDEDQRWHIQARETHGDVIFSRYQTWPVGFGDGLPPKYFVEEETERWLMQALAEREGER